MRHNVIVTKVELTEWGSTTELNDAWYNITLESESIVITIKYRPGWMTREDMRCPYTVGDTHVLDLETGGLD